jgi:signal transduction histidine kinase
MVRMLRGESVPPPEINLQPRIAVIAASPVFAAAFARVLPGARITALEASGAMRAVRERDPDLICVEIGLDGEVLLELAGALKASVDTAHVPIIAFSAPDQKLAALEAGVDHWLDARVFSEEELGARARGALRTSAIARAVRASRHELRLRRDWVRYLAHDLRGSLAAATAALEHEELRASVERELRRGAALVGDLVDADRIRAGVLQLRRADVELVALARRAADRFARAASDTGVEILIEAAAPAIVASCDEALVERALGNLVENALRFAPPASPITVELEERSGRAIVAVANWGASIAPARAAELFDPFVSIGEGAPRVGLGLPFCKLVAEAHGGGVAVEEPDGGGARFVLSLPRV